MKKIGLMIAIVIIVASSITYYFLSVKDIERMSKTGIDNKENEMLIGKKLYITVSQEEKVDYYCVLVPKPKSKFALWRQEEREKMAEFMKTNNYIISAGNYVINQADTFEKAKEIFKFSKNIQ